MSESTRGWETAVAENRESLERIAEHGKTKLADHVREILDEYDEKNGVVPTFSKDYIYAIKSDDGYYKIGRSSNPKRRLKSLSVGNPNELTLVASSPVVEAQRREKDIHEQFGEWRVRGEWFDLPLEKEPELIEFIEEAEVGNSQ